MITGVHVVVFAPEAERARAFFRDVLALESVDAGDWPIFALPPAELACHPAGGSDARHELFLMCDDLASTLAELRSKGVEVADEISEQRWGARARIDVPGLGPLCLYEPRHPSPLA